MVVTTKINRYNKNRCTENRNNLSSNRLNKYKRKSINNNPFLINKFTNNKQKARYKTFRTNKRISPHINKKSNNKINNKIKINKFRDKRQYNPNKHMN